MPERLVEYFVVAGARVRAKAEPERGPISPTSPLSPGSPPLVPVVDKRSGGKNNQVAGDLGRIVCRFVPRCLPVYCW